MSTEVEKAPPRRSNGAMEHMQSEAKAAQLQEEQQRILKTVDNIYLAVFRCGASWVHVATITERVEVVMLDGNLAAAEASVMVLADGKACTVRRPTKVEQKSISRAYRLLHAHKTVTALFQRFMRAAEGRFAPT